MESRRPSGRVRVESRGRLRPPLDGGRWDRRGRAPHDQLKRSVSHLLVQRRATAAVLRMWSWGVRRRSALAGGRADPGAAASNRVSGVACGPLTGQPSDRICVERLGAIRGLRPAVSRRGLRALAGVHRWRRPTPVGTGRAGAILLERCGLDGGARRNRAHLHAGKPRAAVRSGSVPFPTGDETTRWLPMASAS